MMPVMADMTGKTLITEHDVRMVAAGGVIRISASALVTPLAADLAKERQVSIERAVVASSASRKPRIAIGADHAGFVLKETLRRELAAEGRDLRVAG